MDQVRTKVRAIILAITGFILALLVIRFILIFVGADRSNFLVSLLLSVSGFFVNPVTTFAEVTAPSGVDGNAIMAMVIYTVLGILISEIVTSFLYDHAWDVLVQIIDAIFKVLEFLLVTRIALKLFGIKIGTSVFVGQIYGLTDWSQGLIPSRPFLNGQVEISSLLVLIILVIIDFATESVMAALRKRILEWEKTRMESKPKPAAPAAVTPPPQPVVINHQPAPQNITINVPMPPAPAAPQQNVEKQIINVHPVPKSTLQDAQQISSEG